MKTALDAAAEWKADTGKTVSIAYASSAAILPRVKTKIVNRCDPAQGFVTFPKRWIANGLASSP